MSVLGYFYVLSIWWARNIPNSQILKKVYVMKIVINHVDVSNAKKAQLTLLMSISLRDYWEGQINRYRYTYIVELRG